MKAQRIIITGEIGAGKTSFCQHMARLGQQSGLKVRGILSLAVFDGGQKVSIQAVNLENAQNRLLAHKQDRKGEPGRLGWAFEEDVVQWVNGVLEESVPCDLLIVDELGPLEFDRGQGFQQGLELLDGGQFSAGIVVIRPHLVNRARKRWPDAREVPVQMGENDSRQADQVFDSLSFSDEWNGGE